MSDAPTRRTAFQEFGFRETVRRLIEKTKALYQSDAIPWVVGYSGGKDSTAVLQLIWYALQELQSEGQAKKTVHVISTDTLVENPIVAMWVKHSLKRMNEAVQQQGLPLRAERLTPKLEDRFWVNLVGRGYPSPRHKFRWCTSRLKISPSNDYIRNMVKQNGEAILVLGTRKAESTVRSATMSNYEQGSTRQHLSRNKELDRVWVYSPIADWSNDDVWQYLMQEQNPWGYRNEDLLGMYQGATADGECPLVVDSSTPSCGDSRFGCYVCTMVGEDKSMSAMIQNDTEKEWMLPLLHLRSLIDTNDSNSDKRTEKIKKEREKRDFRRISGHLTVHVGSQEAGLVHGPYIQSFREALLAEILLAQQAVREMGPPEVADIELLPQEELEEIRRIWVMEKHEVEDSLPVIYERVTRKPYPGAKHHRNPIFNAEDLTLLRSLCEAQAEDGKTQGELHYHLVRELLHVEYQHRTMARRNKLLEKLSSVLDKGAFDDADEAAEYALERELVKIQSELNRSSQGGGSTDEKMLRQAQKERRELESKKLLVEQQLERLRQKRQLIQTDAIVSEEAE